MPRRLAPDDELRNNPPIGVKLPDIALGDLRQIAVKEGYTPSTIVYYLFLRGWQQYLRDGKLYVGSDPLAFLRRRRKQKHG